MAVNVGAIHTRLEALVNDNVESSNQTGRGKGSSTYQTRQNVTGALLNKLEKRRKEIDDLEERVVSDGREIIRRRCDDSSPSFPFHPSLSLSPALLLFVIEGLPVIGGLCTSGTWTCKPLPGGTIRVCIGCRVKSSNWGLHSLRDYLIIRGIRL